MNETDIVIASEAKLTTYEQSHKNLMSFVKKTLRESKDIRNGTTGDYGTLPGTKKKTLLKPGAEKLLKLFGFSATNTLVKEVEDFEKGFVYYKYKCVVVHAASGTIMADATRSSNNKESSFVRQGKSAYELANNVEAKAQKRALVAATVQATMASEIFETGEGEFESEAPGRTITQDEDPNRIKVLSGYFAAASDRGINTDNAKAIAYKKCNATSLKDIATEDIRKLTEALIKTYRVVNDGEKPQKFVTQEEAQDVTPTEIQPDTDSKPAGDTGTVEQSTPVAEPTASPVGDGESVSDAEVVEETPVERHCPNTKKHGKVIVKTPPGRKNSFCSDECEEEYWGPAKKKSTNRLDEFIKSKGKVGAPGAAA